jgi:hypothetical protein
VTREDIHRKDCGHGNEEKDRDKDIGLHAILLRAGTTVVEPLD